MRNLHPNARAFAERFGLRPLSTLSEERKAIVEVMLGPGVRATTRPLKGQRWSNVDEASRMLRTLERVEEWRDRNGEYVITAQNHADVDRLRRELAREGIRVQIVNMPSWKHEGTVIAISRCPLAA